MFVDHRVVYLQSQRVCQVEPVDHRVIDIFYRVIEFVWLSVDHRKFTESSNISIGVCLSESEKVAKITKIKCSFLVLI